MTKEYITVEQAEAIANQFMEIMKSHYILGENIVSVPFTDFHQALNLAVEQVIGEPVGHVIQMKSDGSIGNIIAPTNWVSQESIMGALRNDPWVIKGLAEVVPLYALNKDKPIQL